MKLLFAIKGLVSAVGGAERVLCMVSSELANRGHEVTIITFDKPGGMPFYPLDPRVKRIDLGIGDTEQPAGLIETLVRMKELRIVACAERPDAAIGMMHSVFVPLAVSLVGTGIPSLGCEHTVKEYYQKYRFQYLLLILAAPLLVKVTVLSHSIRSRYTYWIRQRMEVMPNPVEVATYSANVGKTKESYTLLAVGRLNTPKNFETLIRAFAKIATEFPKWHLKILGDGPLRSDLQSLIELLEMKSKVYMPGITKAISDEYSSAEIFVIPSRFEAFGLVTAEAMSHGLPVIGYSDCPGTNELIESDKTGLLVEPSSDRVTSLAFAMSKLMGDPIMRKRLGDAGRQAINNKHSIRHICDLWEGMLSSTIKVSQ